MHHPTAGSASVCGAIAIALLLGPATTAVGAARDADTLAQRAQRLLASGDYDQRRQGLAELDEAARLAPGRADLWLALGRAHHDLGHPRESRAALERCAALAPDNAEARLALGVAWKWDWLNSLENESFEHAVAALDRAAGLAPQRAEIWLELTALALVRGDADVAAGLASRAWRADPEGAMPAVAEACAAYRLGLLPLADSLFRVARERLPDDLRRRFADVTLFGGSAPRDSTDSRASAERFWLGNDPDLTTVENEAELSYDARLGSAMLLFGDGGRVRWDLRTEMVVRYGMPASIQYNRPGGSHNLLGLKYVADDTFGYPFNEQVWGYPALGMSAWLVDRSLEGRYSRPVHGFIEVEPRPDPGLLAGRSDLVVLGNGRGVYRALAPGLHPREVEASVMRFPGEPGARLVARLTTPGGPADTLWGTWAVVGEDGREVTRARRALSVSACDPTGLRTADFAVELPPGRYRVGFAVEDAHRGRGIVTRDAEVPAPPRWLALSDVVLLCGGPEGATAGPGVRFEPSVATRVARGSLTVYFEIANLTLDPRGEARFTYTYRLRRAEAPAGRGSSPPEFEATHEETNLGSLRRQFVTVPLGAIREGRYALEIEVHDAIGGRTVAGRLDFERVASDPRAR